MPRGWHHPPIAKVVTFKATHRVAFGAVDVAGDVEGRFAVDFVGD